MEILERIKHFFSVPNVHFVLGVQINQLCNSVLVAYGPNIDAQTYLQKFIHLTFHLVDRERYSNERTVTRFVDYLEKELDFKSEDQEAVHRATELVRHVVESRNLSLRAIERIMSNLAIAFAYTPNSTLRPPPILGGLCVLKVAAPALFKKAKRGTLRYPAVKEALALEVPDYRGKRLNEWHVNWWRLATDDTLEAEKIQEFSSSLRLNLDDRREIVPFVANDVIDRLTPKNQS